MIIKIDITMPRKISLFCVDRKTKITTKGLKYNIRSQPLTSIYYGTLNESLCESIYIDFDKSKEVSETIFSVYGNKIFVILILLYIFIIFSFNRFKNE